MTNLVANSPSSPQLMGAYGVNNSGHIVGHTASPGPALPHGEAFLWTNAIITLLGAPTNSTGSTAYAINNSDQIVGGPYDSGNPFLWNNGALTDLFSTGGGNAYAINDQGQVAGENDGFAFLWDQGTVTRLVTSNTAWSTAYGINSQGQVVGTDAHFIGTAGGGAFLYRDGVMFDLNQLIPPDSGWGLQTAYGINDAGQIVGIGLHTSGDYSGFLLTPIFSLRIEGSGGSFALFWPKLATGYRLMSAAELNGNASDWLPVGGDVLDAGAEWKVVVPSPSAGHGYFRLQKP